jgi:hypothetical protein
MHLGRAALAVLGMMAFPACAGAPSPRVVAIGDVHGDLPATREVLRLAGVLDEQDQWIGGTTIVVQTGDQLDRGDDEPAILDLLDRLAIEAAASGGAFHILNGNHELMNARLDFRYVTPDGFVDYEPAEHVTLDSTLSALPDSQLARAIAYRPGGREAARLATRDVWTLVDGTLFVHGGILPEHIDYGLDRINEETKQWLRGEGPYPQVLSGRESPVWTRRYSDEVDESDCELIADVLERLGAERIAVGHTVQDGGVTSYCDDRIWCIDVGLASAYGGPTEAIEILDGEVRILGR